MFIPSKWAKPEDCDVKNIDRLRTFQPILERWKTILSGDDPHSIEQQLIKIAGDDALYRSFNEGLWLNQKRKNPLPLPATLIELIHDRYFYSQVLLLRRLFEKKATKQKLDVFSLRTVLAEMKNHKDIIVRETYVCYDGTPYAIEECRHDWRVEANCSHRHRVFDSLCTPLTSSRSREDKIDICIIESCDAEISKVIKRLEYYSNKYFAHASDIANREPTEKELPLLSLGYLQRLHKSAIWLSQTLGKIADQLVLTEVPTPVFDQFEGWEHLFNKRIKESLHKIWGRRVALLDKWAKMYWHTDTLYLTISKVRTTHFVSRQQIRKPGLPEDER